jgi:hypothetical protein
LAHRHTIQSQVSLLETAAQNLYQEADGAAMAVELAIYGLHYEKIAKRICAAKPL